jgi:PGF-CTERM protein
VLALSLVALAAVAGATATDGAATSRLAQEATNNGTPEASFADDRIAVQDGQVAAIDVRVANTTEATVVLGSSASNYELTVNVTDGNGDGKVGLQLDTGAVGADGSPVSTFRDADSLTVVEESVRGDGLDAAGYSLQVYTGGVSGQPSDTAIMMVQAAETTTTTTTTTTDPTTSTTTSTTTTAATTATTTSDGQPGFGLLVALVGIVAAALLAIRR